MRAEIALILGVVLGAALLAGGRVAAQPPEWQTIQAEHATVVFPSSQRTVAEEAARILERAHRFWRERLGASPRERVTLVLREGGDLTQVTTSVFPHNLMVIERPGAGAPGAGMPGWRAHLEPLIFVEYGKIVDLSRGEGLTADLQGILGKLVAPGLAKPLLLREGIPQLGLARDPLAEAVVREMARTGHFPTLAGLSAPRETFSWPPPELAARAVGRALLSFLQERYGEEVPRRISEAYAERPLLGLAGELGWAGGRPLEELYREFQAWAAGRFEEAERVAQARGGVTSGRRVGRLGYDVGGPAWSPDGAGIVYRHEDPLGGPELRWVDRDGAQDRALLLCRCGAPAWLDRRTLVYPKLHTGEAGRPIYDLYLYELDGSRERQLTFEERTYLVRTFPDGRRLLVARHHPGLESSLVVFDVESRSRLILREFGPDRRVHSMAISPDGRQIALSLWTRGEGHDLYLLTGERLVRLTHDPAIDIAPAFTPDGSAVLFASDRGGVFDLYAVRPEGGALFRVTHSLTGALEPAPSPDGAEVAFVGYGANGFHVRAAPLEPAGWEPLASEPAGEEPAEATEPPGAEPVPYDPAPALVPTFWLPLVGLNQLGLFTRGEDPLGHHAYRLTLGVNLVPPKLFYGSSYTNAQLAPRFRFELSGTPLGHRQQVTLTLPWTAGWGKRRALTLGLAAAAGEGELFARGEIEELGENHPRRHSKLAVEGGWQGDVRRLALEWRERVVLPVESPAGPHRLALRAITAWGDRAAFRLGGVAGPYPLRGYPEGVAAGSHLLLAGVEYRFPVWPIGWGCCGGSPGLFFLDRLLGNLFLDAGTAGAPLNPEALKVGVGAELALRVVLGYGLWEGSLRLGLAYGVEREELTVYFDLGP